MHFRKKQEICEKSLREYIKGKNQNKNMTFKGKEVQVALVGDAKRVYIELNRVVKNELKKGKKGTNKQILFNSINRAIENLKLNPQFGIHIKKKQIPRYYVEKFDAENLWKCNLSKFWRMIYWIDGSYEVKIINFVLDIIEHEDYNNKFRYSKH